MYKNVKAEKSRPKNPGQKSWPKNPGQKSVCKITESFHLLVPLYSSGQSKKGSTILTYDSRVVNRSNLLERTTLELYFTIVECL